MHADNRRRYFELLRREGAAAIVPTATTKVRNADTDFPFRPCSDFWYLTGFTEPGALLVMLPALGDQEEDRCVLFLRDKDPLRETWDGRRLGVEAAPDALDIDESRDIEVVWEDLPDLLKGRERIVYRTGLAQENDRRMLELMELMRRRARGPVMPPVELIDQVGLLHELRLIKSEAELDLMRQGAAITCEGFLAAMAEAEPGKPEYALQAVIEYTFKRRGCTHYAYPIIAGSGANACTLHYTENDSEMQAGQLILVDAGAEFSYYSLDVTRTFPISGTFNPEQRAIYGVVLRAQLAGIDAARKGAPFSAIHAACLAKIVDGLIELGLVQGTAAEVMESKSYDRFFMHSSSHWLGLDTHDVGCYAVDGQVRNLQPGMVLTVEPGIYIGQDETEVEERWRGIGIRIEDDVLVTETGNEVLTAAIPKEIAAVEAACQGREALAASPGA